MAHLRQRGDRWQAIVQLDGRKISRTFGTDYDAQRWADEQEGLTEPTALVADSRTAVAVYVAAYVARRAPLLSGATVTNYGVGVKAVRESRFATTAIADLTKADVEGWLGRLAAETVTDKRTGATRKRYGAASLRIRLKVLRMALEDARDNKLIEHDPTGKIALPSLPDKIDKVVEPGDESAVIAACDGDPYLLAFYLLGVDAGLRWQEVAALERRHVNLTLGFVSVEQVVERDPHGIRDYPKGHRRREVPMVTGGRLEVALRALLAVHPGDGPLFTVGTMPGERAGAVADPDALLRYDVWRVKVWKPLLRRAGLTKRQVGFHGLRHTCGSRLAAGGMPRSEIARWLGHADEKTTERYVHVGQVDSLRQSAAVALERFAARQAAAA